MSQMSIDGIRVWVWVWYAMHIVPPGHRADGKWSIFNMPTWRLLKMTRYYSMGLLSARVGPVRSIIVDLQEE